MAWTAPNTHATGDVLPASDWNTYVRDNVKYLHGDSGIISFNNSGWFGSGGNPISGGPALAVWTLATTMPAFSILNTTDANARLQINQDGSMNWGPGGASAPDTTLWRRAQGNLTLGTTGQSGNFTIFSTQALLQSLLIYKTTDAQPTFQLNNDGSIRWGPGGATAVDTTLWRLSANNLQTDGSFWAGISLVLGAVAGGTLYFNAGLDTYMNRNVAGVLGLNAKLFEGNPALTTVTVPATFTPNLATGLMQRVNVSAGGASTLTIGAPTNSPVSSQTSLLVVQIANNGGGTITISWNGAFVGGSTLALPTSRATGTTTDVLFAWDGANWRIVSIG